MRASGLAIGLLGASLALAGLASADDQASASGAAGATVSALPSGTLARPPHGAKPTSIPRSEKVPGFLVAPGDSGRGRPVEFVTITPDAKVKNALELGMGEGVLGSAACFTTEGRRFQASAEDGQDAPWGSDLQPIVHLNAGGHGMGRPDVEAIHSERFVDEGGKASLEAIDAWVDPATRGVRLIARSTVPLQLMSTLLHGTKVYAARDGSSVHVILVSPMDGHRRQEPLFGIEDGNFASSSCGHMRITMKTERGQGRAASFVSSVELDALPGAEVQRTEDARFGHEVRVRPLHVSASVSWPSRAKEALLAVSAGWDAREQTTRR